VSVAWAAVPLSGSVAEDAALRIAAPRSPAGDEDDSLSYPPIPSNANYEALTREYEDKKQRIMTRAREREAAILPTELSQEEREARLVAAAERAVAESVARWEIGRASCRERV
jgi:hypothetical protein